MKKQNLNKQIYTLHLHLTDNWGSLWPHIQNSIDQELEKISAQNYTKLKSKLGTLRTKQQKLPQSKETFGPRIVNIEFSDDEITLLNKGLKYTLICKNKNWIRNLALEAETAISFLPEAQREFYRWQTAKRIDSLYTKQHTQNIDYKGKKEMNTLRSTKKKLSANSAIITQSDKGNSIVIIKLGDYNKKLLTSSPPTN